MMNVRVVYGATIVTIGILAVGAAAAAVPMIHIILSNVAMLLVRLAIELVELAVKSVELAVAVVTVRLVVLLVVLQRSGSSRVSSTEFILSSDITEADRGIYVGVHIRRVFYLFEIHYRFHASLFVHGSLTTFKILSTYALSKWQEFRMNAASWRHYSVHFCARQVQLLAAYSP